MSNLVLKVREVGKEEWESVPGVSYPDRDSARDGAKRLFEKLNPSKEVNFHVAIALRGSKDGR